MITQRKWESMKHLTSHLLNIIVSSAKENNITYYYLSYFLRLSALSHNTVQQADHALSAEPTELDV